MDLFGGFLYGVGCLFYPVSLAASLYLLFYSSGEFGFNYQVAGLFFPLAFMSTVSMIVLGRYISEDLTFRLRHKEYFQKAEKAMRWSPVFLLMPLFLYMSKFIVEVQNGFGGVSPDKLAETFGLLANVSVPVATAASVVCILVGFLYGVGVPFRK